MFYTENMKSTHSTSPSYSLWHPSPPPEVACTHVRDISHALASVTCFLNASCICDIPHSYVTWLVDMCGMRGQRWLELQRGSWHTHCNTLQHTATPCITLHRIATDCNRLQQTATDCYTLQNTATRCNTLQHAATHCNTLQHNATHCNALQRTAMHCNTLQHTAMTPIFYTMTTTYETP